LGEAVFRGMIGEKPVDDRYQKVFGGPGAAGKKDTAKKKNR